MYILKIIKLFNSFIIYIATFKSINLIEVFQGKRNKKICKKKGNIEEQK